MQAKSYRAIYSERRPMTRTEFISTRHYSGIGAYLGIIYRFSMQSDKVV